MKNLKIGKKLLITFGVILILFLCTVIMAIYSLTNTGKNFSTFYDTPYEITNRTTECRTKIQTVATFVGYSMMEEDDEKTKEYVQSAQDTIQQLRDDTAYMKENFPEANSIIEKYDTTMKEIMEDRDKVLEMALENKNSEAIQLYFDTVRPGFVKALDYLVQINDMAKAQADTNYQDSMSQKTVITITLTILSVVTLFLTAFLAFYLTRSLTQPISEIEKVAKNMTQGCLDVSISYESKDEIGSLSDSMRAMTGNLKDIIGDIGRILSELADGNFHVTSNCLQNYIGDYIPILTSMRLIRDNLNTTLTQINQAANQVASGSEQVSSGSQALSQGTTQQASSVEELAATINEISDQVKNTAQNAIDAREQTKQAENETSVCNEQMQEMITAMVEISNKSTEIGKIIKTIEDIAFQTNILALNAAVEAARAGTAGKGFAVVADEVRNLASKSADASKNTSSLIEGSIEAVEKGTRIANETASSLSQVVQSTQIVATAVEKISVASNEQASSIAQITQGIDQISSVVQTNSATAEESAAASEELSGQAQMLNSLVGQFKLLESSEANVSSTALPELKPQYSVSQTDIDVQSTKY